MTENNYCAWFKIGIGLNDDKNLEALFLNK